MCRPKRFLMDGPSRPHRCGSDRGRVSPMPRKHLQPAQGVESAERDLELQRRPTAGTRSGAGPRRPGRVVLGHPPGRPLRGRPSPIPIARARPRRPRRTAATGVAPPRVSVAGPGGCANTEMATQGSTGAGGIGAGCDLPEYRRDHPRRSPGGPIPRPRWNPPTMVNDRGGGSSLVQAM